MRAPLIWTSLCAMVLSSCGPEQTASMAVRRTPLESAAPPQVVTQRVTYPDGSKLFAVEGETPRFGPVSNGYPLISVDPSLSFQSMDGFGFTLTEGSAEVIRRMSTSAQQALLRELFDPAQGIGISVLRVAIGASDLSASTYSYLTFNGPPLGSVLTFRCANGRFASSNDGAKALTCDRSAAQGWEQFTLVDAGNGKVALRCNTGRYVTGTSSGLTCSSTSVGVTEQFTWTNAGDHQVQLRGSNGLFVSQHLSAFGIGPVACNRTQASGWETFSWNATSGSTPGLGFSLAGPDLTHLVPVLQRALAVNPQLKILATPWSAPPAFKTNQDWRGGQLRPERFGDYGQYFVRYIEAMAALGIPIWAVTPQNEPENPFNVPSMKMSAEEQTTFINDALGPALRNAGHATKIIAFDHNCDHPAYPTYVSNHSAYVDGSAFHLYAGDIRALSEVRAATGKNIYFTEQFTSSKGTFAQDLAWHLENVMLGAPNNWARTALEWNLATDPAFGPHTPGGCSECKGGLTVSGDSVTRNVSYYIVAHLSKLVRPGAVRIQSSTGDASLVSTAYVNDAQNGGSKVVVVLNRGSTAKTFNLGYQSQAVTLSLPAGAVGTYVWY